MTQTAELLTQRKKRDRGLFADFHSSFAVHPDNSQLILMEDDYAIAGALRNIIMTDKYERPMNPDFGVGIKRYLFENIDVIIAGEIKEDIKRAISIYEPRVEIRDIKVGVIERALIIKLAYVTVNNPEIVNITVSMKRVR